MSTPPDNRINALFDQATGDAPSPPDRAATPEERAAAALHNALAPSERMPDAARARLLSLADNLGRNADRPVNVGRPPGRLTPWMAAAAVVAIAGTVGIVSLWSLQERERALASARIQLEQMRQTVEGNNRLLAEARETTDSLTRGLAERTTALTAQEVALADAARRQTEIAAQLAEAASRLSERETLLAQSRDKERELSRELSEARLTIARFTEPVDPAVLAQNRTKLLEVPDTIRIAWAPFDLPDAPAEQRTVQGDVTWNDRLHTGYLRFVGLAPNDPALEQYQVWVIDERGMEQKVSGGIFNATAQGEVIVPIEPGIDVGRVALFAITVEKPGGTWVPDLKRRVVVAPRS
jgi:hypothetical protein